MTSSVEVQLHQPLAAGDGHHGFQKGHPRYSGRPKGSRNKFGGDLREAVVAAIQATGFIEKDDKGNPIATGRGGCQVSSSGWHARSPAAPRRRALPGQDYARTDERYAVMTISNAILDDSTLQNIACKTFGAQVLSPLSMLGSVSSNPAPICNPTRLHSTHLRTRSVRPS
jgi:hypothetical protein